MTAVFGIALLVMATLFRASSEVFRSSSRITLRHLVDENASGASAASIFLDHPEYFRGLLFGLECAAALSGSVLLATAALSEQSAAVQISGLVVAALSYALLNGFVASLARFSGVRVFQMLARLVAPIVGLIARLSPPLTREESAAAAAASDTVEGEREAVEELIEEGLREGIGNSENMKIVSRVVELRDTRVGEIMIKRGDIFALSAELPPREIALRMAASGYSRVPIYSGDLDAIAGIFHVLDLLKVGPHDLPPLRPVVTANQNERCSELLLRCCGKPRTFVL